MFAKKSTEDDREHEEKAEIFIVDDYEKDKNFIPSNYEKDENFCDSFVVDLKRKI